MDRIAMVMVARCRHRRWLCRQCKCVCIFSSLCADVCRYFCLSFTASTQKQWLLTRSPYFHTFPSIFPNIFFLSFVGIWKSHRRIYIYIHISKIVHCHFAAIATQTHTERASVRKTHCKSVYPLLAFLSLSLSLDFFTKQKLFFLVELLIFFLTRCLVWFVFRVRAIFIHICRLFSILGKLCYSLCYSYSWILFLFHFFCSFVRVYCVRSTALVFNVCRRCVRCIENILGRRYVWLCIKKKCKYHHIMCIYIM